MSMSWSTIQTKAITNLSETFLISQGPQTQQQFSVNVNYITSWMILRYYWCHFWQQRLNNHKLFCYLSEIKAKGHQYMHHKSQYSV